MYDNLLEAPDYWTYWMRRKYLHFDRYVAPNVDRYVNKLRSQLMEMEFDDGDSISVLPFLKKTLKTPETVSESTKEYQRGFPYFMKEPA